MKVICINGLKKGQTGLSGISARSVEVIYEGEAYNVINEETHFGHVYYFLDERPHGTGYNAKKFMPCSDIDELELVNEKMETA